MRHGLGTGLRMSTHSHRSACRVHTASTERHPSPPGLREVQQCRKRGFHPDHQRNGPNAGNGVYEEASHVRWVPGAALQVIDMRR